MNWKRKSRFLCLVVLLLYAKVLLSDPAKGSLRSVVLHLQVHGKTNKSVEENAGEEECLYFLERQEKSPLGSECICKTGGWSGRLGNRLHATSKIIGEADYMHFNVFLPQDMLEGWNPPAHSWIYDDSKDPRYASRPANMTCGTRTPREWFDVKDWSAAPRCYLQLMRQYYGINHTHVLGKRCFSNEHVALHVRSGDVVRGGWNEAKVYRPGNVHNLYGLFPTAYYISVIRNARERRGSGVHFFVFCETMGNPTCEFFKKLSLLDDRVSFRVGEPLIDDLFLMLCASETAASRGSFQNVFDLSTKRRLAHSFSDSPDPASVASTGGLSTVMHYIASKEEATKFTKETFPWNNTGYQRYLIDKAFDINHTNVLCALPSSPILFGFGRKNPQKR